MRKYVLAACALLLLALAVPASAGAVPIHKHVTTYDVAYVPGASGQRDRVRIPREKVVVVNVAPADSDQDGVANADDDCPGTAGSSDYSGCPPPPPPPAPTTSSTTTYAATPPTTSYSSGGGCVGMEAESGSTGYATDTGNGYIGCYQIAESNYGATGPCAGLGTDPAGQDACAANICATQGPSAWTNPAGENPCGRLGG